MKTRLFLMTVFALGAQVSFAEDNYIYCDSTDDSNLIVQVFHDGTEATKAEIAVSRVTGKPEAELLGRFRDLSFRSEYVPELKRNVERYFGKGMNFSWRPIGRKQGPGGILFTIEETPYSATLRCVYTPKKAQAPVEP